MTPSVWSREQQKEGAVEEGVIQSLVEAGMTVDASHVVVRNGKDIESEVAGWAEVDERRFREDAIVRICSMSKPITSIADVTQWKQGAFEERLY